METQTRYFSNLFIKKMGIHEYGNTGCGVFKGGIQSKMVFGKTQLYSNEINKF